MIIERIRTAWSKIEASEHEEDFRKLKAIELALALQKKDEELQKISIGSILPVVIDFINNGYK